MRSPLSDLVIVEAKSDDCPLPLRLAIGFAGRLAADLGAEVIAIEPSGGDPVRRIGPFKGGESALFAFLNAGKRSIIADVSGPSLTLGDLTRRASICLADAQFASRLVRQQGQVISQLTLAGDDQRHGVAPTEFTLLALGGLLDLVGSPDREPLKIGGHQLAYAAGIAAFTGALAALRTPGGDTVTTSLAEMAVWLNWKAVAAESWGIPVPTRIGRNGEWQVIRCADGYVVLVYRDPDWATIKALVGDPRLEEPRFQKRIERKRYAGLVAQIVESSFLKLTRAEIRGLALAKRLPIGPVWSVDDLVGDPHMLARQFFSNVTLGGTPVPMPRLPVLFDGEAPQRKATAAAQPAAKG